MSEAVIQLDRQLLLALNGSDSSLLDAFFMTVTRTATWIPLFVALLFVAYSRARTPGLPPAAYASPQTSPQARWAEVALFAIGAALVVLVADRVSSGLCKPFFHRFRPSHEPLLDGLVDLVDGYRGGPYGFISSHAANTFGIAAYVAATLRHRSTTCTLFLWAILSSFSRIYLGVHYPGDILAGALFGIVCGIGIARLVAYVHARFLAPHPAEPRPSVSPRPPLPSLADCILPSIFFATLVLVLSYAACRP